MDITDNELENMTRFYLKEVFKGIPFITTHFATVEELGDKLGITEYTEGDDYIIEKDVLLDMHEYAHAAVEIAPGVFDDVKYEPSYLDPENHPKIEILLSDTLKTDIYMLTGVLLHELCHYYCWYMGYDHHDGDLQFERRLRELRLPSCSDYRYSKEARKHISLFDFKCMMRPYVEMYQGVFAKPGW